MRLACPRCPEGFEAKDNARNVECPACGFVAPSPRARGLGGDEVECPRCNARTKARLGRTAKCRHCGYKAKVPAPMDGQGVEAAVDPGGEDPPALLLECPRCATSLTGRPGQTASCPCGFEATVPGVTLECPRCQNVVHAAGDTATCSCGFTAPVPSA